MVTFKWIPLASVVGSVYQPRLQEDRGLDDLTESIRVNGLLVPLIVLQVPTSSSNAPTYLMRSGHRRRAALLSLQKGATSLPQGHARIQTGEVQVQAVIRDDMTKQEAACAALIDNLERQDLSPYEQACAIKHLAVKMKIPRAELAKRAQTPPDTVDYMIAALDPKNLPIKMIHSWQQRLLEMGHVRLLVRLREQPKQQKQLYTKILKERLSVAQASFWCNRLLDKLEHPLEDREHNLVSERLTNSPLLKELIDNKQLNWDHSKRGGKLILDVEGADNIRKACLEIASVLKGLKL
jgi:ParB family transcriptional regulator, chromosome partitioning protein